MLVLRIVATGSAVTYSRKWFVAQSSGSRRATRQPYANCRVYHVVAMIRFAWFSNWVAHLRLWLTNSTDSAASSGRQSTGKQACLQWCNRACWTCTRQFGMFSPAYRLNFCKLNLNSIKCITSDNWQLDAIPHSSSAVDCSGCRTSNPLAGRAPGQRSTQRHRSSVNSSPDSSAGSSSGSSSRMICSPPPDEPATTKEAQSAQWA